MTFGVRKLGTVSIRSQADAISAAWERVVNDCGCEDLYYCPRAKEIKCPRHSGFDVCCDRVDRHVPVRERRAAGPASHVTPGRR